MPMRYLQDDLQNPTNMNIQRNFQREKLRQRTSGRCQSRNLIEVLVHRLQFRMLSWDHSRLQH